MKWLKITNLENTVELINLSYISGFSVLEYRYNNQYQYYFTMCGSDERFDRKYKMEKECAEMLVEQMQDIITDEEIISFLNIPKSIKYYEMWVVNGSEESEVK